MRRVIPGYQTIGIIDHSGINPDNSVVLSLDKVRVRVFEFDGPDPDTFSSGNKINMTRREDLLWADIQVPPGKTLLDRLDPEKTYYKTGDLVYVSYPTGNASYPIVVGLKYSGSEVVGTDGSIVAETGGGLISPSEYLTPTYNGQGAYKTTSNYKYPRVLSSSVIFHYPLSSKVRISSRYGPRNVGGNASKFHKGVDLAAPNQSNVLAIEDGSVVAVQGGYAYNSGSLRNTSGYGNYISIDHGTIEGKRVVSFYGHLKEPLVRSGDNVTKGQIIAISDNTGTSSGPHLHFELRIDGNAVDPASYSYEPWNL